MKISIASKNLNKLDVSPQSLIRASRDAKIGTVRPGNTASEWSATRGDERQRSDDVTPRRAMSTASVNSASRHEQMRWEYQSIRNPPARDMFPWRS